MLVFPVSGCLGISDNSFEVINISLYGPANKTASFILIFMFIG